MLKASIRFWGREVLGYLGITFASSIILWLIYAGAGRNRLSDIAVMPCYMLSVGAFVIIMEICSYFQLYFSLLLSMSVSRKSVVTGFMAGIAVMILGLTVVMGIVWNIFPGDISEGGRSLLPFMAAGLWLTAAVTIFINTIALKWGKRGLILFFVLLLCIVGGGIAVVMTLGGTECLAIVKSVFNFPGFAVIAAGMGLLLFLLSGAGTAVMMKKYEVHM